MDSDYKLFAKVIECGGLSAAGRALFMSPAVISKRLARLEDRLGVRLVHRTTRRLALTEPGERFYEDVVAILAAIQQAESRLAVGKNIPAGPLKVTAPSSFGRLHIAPYLPQFLDKYPDVELELVLSDSFVDLLGEKIDVAIRITPRLDPGLAACRLASSGRILCAAPSYIGAHGLPETIKELGKHRLLAANGQLPWEVVGEGRECSIEGNSHVKTNSSEIVRELALAGVGIAFRSIWDISPALAAGKLVRILPQYGGSPDRAIYAVHPRMPNVPSKVSSFIEFLVAITLRPSWEN